MKRAKGSKSFLLWVSFWNISIFCLYRYAHYSANENFQWWLLGLFLLFVLKEVFIWARHLTPHWPWELPHCVFTVCMCHYFTIRNQFRVQYQKSNQKRMYNYLAYNYYFLRNLWFKCICMEAMQKHTFDKHETNGLKNDLNEKGKNCHVVTVWSWSAW